MLSQEIEDKIIKARVRLYMQFPFFAILAQHLHPVGSNALPTVGVTIDGTMYVNPTFGDKANEDDWVFILAHEVMHLVTLTHQRMPMGAIHVVWNQASDCVINEIIVEAGIALPREELIKPIYGGKYEKYKEWIAEAIYRDLIKNMDDCPMCKSQNKKGQQQAGESGNEQSGGAGDTEDQDSGDESGGGGKCPIHDPSTDHQCPVSGGSGEGDTEWWDGTGSACGEGDITHEQMEEWKGRAVSAAAAARSEGRMPGCLEKFVTDLLKPKKDWRRELRIAAWTMLKGKWTWKKIGRRTAGIGVRTPGRNPKPPLAAVYIDTSGSMSDEECRRNLSETAEIIRQGGGRGRLLLGDSEIYYDGEVNVSELGNLPVQRGGTDFRVLFDKFRTGEQPKILIGFTDCCGPFPATPPDFPVIWCRPKDASYKQDPPWGKLIEVEV